MAVALTVGIPRGLSRRHLFRDGTVDTTVLVLNRPDHDNLNLPVNVSVLVRLTAAVRPQASPRSDRGKPGLEYVVYCAC